MTMSNLSQDHEVPSVHLIYTGHWRQLLSSKIAELRGLIQLIRWAELSVYNIIRPTRLHDYDLGKQSRQRQQSLADD